MIIHIPSKFSKDKQYLQVITVGDKVVEVESPLPKVNDYYVKNIFNAFNFSFPDERGIHYVIGSNNTPISNLIILLAYEHVFYKRQITMSFNCLMDIVIYFRYLKQCLKYNYPRSDY